MRETSQSHIRSDTRYLFAFAHSAKRLAEYRRFQEFTGIEPHKLLRASLANSMGLFGAMCTASTIEQWQALVAYFTEAAEIYRLVLSNTIMTALKNQNFKLYYHFMSFVLPKFNQFNKLFSGFDIGGAGGAQAPPFS